MQKITFTFKEDGTIEGDTTRMNASAEEKLRLLGEIAKDLGGKLSDEKHNPQQVHENIRVQG